MPEGKCPFNFDAFFVTLIQLLWPRAVLQYNWSLWLTRSQITYKAWFLITWILPALLRWMYSAKMDEKPSWTTSFVIWWKLTFGVLGPSKIVNLHLCRKWIDFRRCATSIYTPVIYQSLIWSQTMYFFNFWFWVLALSAYSVAVNLTILIYLKVLQPVIRSMNMQYIWINFDLNCVNHNLKEIEVRMPFQVAQSIKKISVLQVVAVKLPPTPRNGWPIAQQLAFFLKALDIWEREMGWTTSIKTPGTHWFSDHFSS